MKLLSISYSEHADQPNEWKLEHLTLRAINLLVGRNASGKTRTLNFIGSLAKLLTGEVKPTFNSGDYTAEFDDPSGSFRYALSMRDNRVTNERLERNGTVLLDRGVRGEGTIFTKSLTKHIAFQTPDNELAAVARRDSIQHDFFEPLYQWASSLHHYRFGSEFASRYALLVNEKRDAPAPDHRDASYVISTFRKGQDTLGDKFKEAILSDMKSVDYDIKDIGVGTPTRMTIVDVIDGKLLGLWVHERDLSSITEQLSISQGMLRALVIIIQLNYAMMTQRPTCLLIDDIGEGLDFARSCALIDLIMEKAGRSEVQVVMSTNDRFVMNKVPLDAWSVISRRGGICRAHNSDNAKSKFDEFRFTGLNNFDFFALNFLEEDERVVSSQG